MPIFKLPAPLRIYAQGMSTVQVSGATVNAALTDLVTRFPQIKPHLFEGETLRSFVNIFLGEDDIRFMDGIETRVCEDDILIVIPSIAGGTLYTQVTTVETCLSSANHRLEIRARLARVTVRFRHKHAGRSYESRP